MKEIVIGTRGSALALWQTDWVKDKLALLLPEYHFKVVRIKTKGDKIRDAPLAKIGGKGIFVRQIEFALLREEIDMAVHSMKDLPTTLPDGLTIGAIAERTDPSDALISRNDSPTLECGEGHASLERRKSEGKAYAFSSSHQGCNSSNLPLGAKVGTSSLRRRAQLLHFRPDLKFENLRGNVDTRIAKLKSEGFDAIVLASAGVKRLASELLRKTDFEELTIESLSYEICLPAVGQGAIGIEVREKDSELLGILKRINHFESYTTVTAERALLKSLGGGCQIPIAALGTIDGETLSLEGLVADVDGNRVIRSTTSGKPQQAEEVGKELGEILLDMGAKSLLDLHL